MPELPDVECFRRRFDDHALQRTVRAVHVPDTALLHGTSPQGLGRRLDGHRFTRTARHGKFLLADYGAGWLVLHFGMSGYLRTAPSVDAPPHTALILVFDAEPNLLFVDPRRLGRITVADSPQQFATERGLGVDAAAVDADTFVALAAGRRGTVKGWLTDQSTISGIGNIYADELLFQAGIAPHTDIAALDAATLRHLHGVLRPVFEGAIAADADPRDMPENFLLPHRHEGARCPRCGGAVRRTRISGRTAYFCPRCQPDHPRSA